jgi:hypothetical protein
MNPPFTEVLFRISTIISNGLSLTTACCKMDVVRKDGFDVSTHQVELWLALLCLKMVLM